MSPRLHAPFIAHRFGPANTQAKAIVSIENMVASASINQAVDLNQIARNFFRWSTTRTSSLVWPSG